MTLYDKTRSILQTPDRQLASLPGAEPEAPPPQEGDCPRCHAPVGRPPWADHVRGCLELER